MIGVELQSKGYPVMQKLLSNGILVNCTNVNVIRLLPPFIISKVDIDYFSDNFNKVLSEL